MTFDRGSMFYILTNWKQPQAHSTYHTQWDMAAEDISPRGRVKRYFPEILSEWSDWFGANLSQNRWICIERGTWGLRPTLSPGWNSAGQRWWFLEEPPKTCSLFHFRRAVMQRALWCVQWYTPFTDRHHIQNQQALWWCIVLGLYSVINFYWVLCPMTQTHGDETN